MAQVQFFSKTDENIENFKKSVFMWIEIAKKSNLIPEKYLSILKSKTESETSFINRNDTKNFYNNIIKIADDENLRQLYFSKIKLLSLNRPDNEITYEYLSICEECCVEYISFLNQKQKQDQEKQKLEELKQKENIEKKTNIESLLDQL